jgi:uncharacterized BrkB/YihY/UPF0761 family membrane protein
MLIGRAFCFLCFASALFGNTQLQDLLRQIYRVYDEQFSSYERIYGPLKPAAVYLLWLYFTGAAILIGGEANSEIEKAAAEARHADVRRPEERRSGAKT